MLKEIDMSQEVIKTISGQLPSLTSQSYDRAAKDRKTDRC